VRILKLDHPSLVCLYIRYVSLSTLGVVDNLLPAFGEMPLPRAMPVGFVFPPKITDAATFVRPVPNIHFAALCNHGLIADWTFAGKIGLRFLALPVNERELHTRVCAPQPTLYRGQYRE
jgi:hypothetical protein